jgi:ribonuclease BN (tRNA processing enzyme)
MNLTILGCSGGVAPQKGTTCFLVDDDILIDAGTGLESLTLPEMAKITHLFITHAHLDHISHLPFLLNNLIGELDFTLHVYASSFTIQALRQHIFNDVIWPDFTQLPNKEHPCVVLHPFEVGDSMAVGERRIVALPAEHSIPTMGFWVGELEGKGHFAFTGDCSSNFKFWQALQELPEVEALIVDDQYLEAEKEISLLAKHYYPAALKSDLKQLSYHPKLYLTHLPAYKSEEVWAEAQTVLAEWHPIPLESGMQLHFDASN